MLSAAQLKDFLRTAIDLLSRQSDFAEYEVYAASSNNRIARLAYTSDIPSRGVEEIKSLGADGFQIRIVMRRNRHEVGTASEAGDLTADALKRVIQRALSATVVDPHFAGLPRDDRKLPRGAIARSDLARIPDSALTSCAWQVVGGALSAFQAGRRNAVQPGLVIGGDVSIFHDRIAIGGSNFPDLRADESAHFMSSVTSIIESENAKGTETAVGDSVAAMRKATATLGRTAIRRALSLGGGMRPPSGRYRVVLGPQPVAEILNYMVMGSLSTGAFYAASSAYQGRFGQKVMDERISLIDDPAFRNGPVSRTITCEGLKAKRTELIRGGSIVGLLSNVYDSHRLESDDARDEKLGPGGEGVKFPPNSGYRLGEGGGARVDADAGAAGTNVILKGRGGAPERDLLAAVGDGIYIGRIWYTYPINGQRAGDFTCTVTGDSYRIRDGKLAEPLAPNCLRINANISEVFEHPLAIGAKVTPTIVWGASETYFVPALAVDGIALAEIGEGA